MQLVIHVPDDLIEPIREKLPPPEMGLLETIALDAILGFLQRLEREVDGGDDPASP